MAVCGSGVGACTAANRVPGVRERLTHERLSAHQWARTTTLTCVLVAAWGRIMSEQLRFETFGIALGNPPGSATQIVSALGVLASGPGASDRPGKRAAKILGIRGLCAIWRDVTGTKALSVAETAFAAWILWQSVRAYCRWLGHKAQCGDPDPFAGGLSKRMTPLDWSLAMTVHIGTQKVVAQFPSTTGKKITVIESGNETH